MLAPCVAARPQPLRVGTSRLPPVPQAAASGSAVSSRGAGTAAAAAAALSAPRARGRGRRGLGRARLGLRLGGAAARRGLEPGAHDAGVPLPPGVAAGHRPQRLELSERQLADFDQDGVVLVRGALRGWVEFLRAVTDHQTSHPHPRARDFGFYEYYQRELWATNDGFRDFIFYSPLGHVLAQLARTASVRHCTDVLMVNPIKDISWHQDSQNGPVDRADLVRWWVGMDPCGEGGIGAPIFLRGSHRNATVGPAESTVDLARGDLPAFVGRPTAYAVGSATADRAVGDHRSPYSGGSRDRRSRGRSGLIARSSEPRGAIDPCSARQPWRSGLRSEHAVGGHDLPSARPDAQVVEPGDLIAWDVRAIHRVSAPPPGTARRALGGTAARSGALYRCKKDGVAPCDYDGHGLEDGAPLAGPFFPRVFPRREPAEEAFRSQGRVRFLQRDPWGAAAGAAAAAGLGLARGMAAAFRLGGPS
ncbi:unnamed protein product [Prorocentrum cordatum]|uniref:Phytanoyl-dioxygenase n=1 Tax=Prorocentrum cordatum TaxID=2364126 RepID=A0ABN9X4A7_9DINO|nr:unnamed protein product [Polarella glacialis]